MPSLFKTLFTWRNFFALFSKVQLGIFAGTFLLTLILRGTEVEGLFTFFANISLFLLCVRVGTIIHECGHLVVGIWVSARPERMVLGLGHEVARINIGTFKIIINNQPLGGYVSAPFHQQSNLRLRVAAFTLGGVGANVVVALVFYFLFGLDNPFRTVDFASAFMIANAINIYNLIPFNTTAYGSTMATDGLLLVKLPFQRAEATPKDFDYSTRMQAITDLFEQKQWSEALELLKTLREEFPADASVQINLAYSLYKVGELDQSFAIILELEQHKDEKWFRPLLGPLLNMKAWMLLEQGNIEEAYKNAYRAYVLLSRHSAIIGTYGSILIERGDIDEGLQLLVRLVDFRYPNSSTLSAAMYVMYGYGLRKNFKRAKKYKDFIDRNITRFDRDEKVLYERCLARLSPQQTLVA